MYRQKELLKSVNDEIQREQQTLDDLQRKYNELPPGHLISSKSRGYPYKYQSISSNGETKRIRIHEDRPDELSLMRSLELKRSIEQHMPKIEKNISALKKLKKYFTVIDDENIIFPDGSLDPKKWLSENYNTNLYKEERKNVRVSENVYVRSKAEAAIYRSLETAGVWFRYEPAFRVSSRKVTYPDFVILRKYDRRPIMWEHCGALNFEPAARAYLNKINEYSGCGFTVGNNLIITVEDPDHPFSIADAESVIRDMKLDQ